MKEAFAVLSNATVLRGNTAAQGNSISNDGSLAYALPVVQQLLPRVLPRLRALVLLPTRGLAAQVARVFEALVHDTPLRVGLAVGQEGSAFAREREALLGPPRGGADDDRGDPISAAGCPAATTVAGGRSAVDVLVATPGRLVARFAVTVRTSRKAMVATRWNRPKRCQARSTRQTWHSAPPSPRAPPLASCWTGCHKRPEEGRSVQKRAVGSRGHSRRRRAWHAGMAGLGGEERLSHGCQVHVGQRRYAGITHREGVAGYPEIF